MRIRDCTDNLVIVMAFKQNKKKFALCLQTQVHKTNNVFTVILLVSLAGK